MRFLPRASRTTRVLMCLSMLAGGPGGAAAMPERADVRVLIDISGSMRQNDPQNLRRPALRMLAGLLQPGTRAGVWTFASRVDNLVPVVDVDAAWKRRIQAVSEQVASPGQFTNIGGVLEEAARDWQDDATTHARHLILLTDGMVDVSRDDATNRAAREDIIERLLPRLQAGGIRVHTIALSERADHALMRRLAAETGGWYQQVAQADELQRAFLRMFESVDSPDAVPLRDNRFVVDSSIDEATVLVFSAANAPPVVLRSPSGVEYADSDLPAGVVWHRDLGYDLITIASPQKGEWTLDAEVDPDNRVMIVTDLRLRTSPVPAHLAAGEQLPVEVHLTNRDELVTRQDFLRLLDVSAAKTGEGGTRPLALGDRGQPGDARAGDGRYGMVFGESEVQDAVELHIAVDSPTFMREKRFRLKVHEPVDVRVGDSADGPVLTADVQAAVMRPDANLTAWQQDLRGQRMELHLAADGPWRWSAPLADLVAPVYLRWSGTTRLGNRLERTLGPVTPPGVVPPPVLGLPAKKPAAVVEPVAALQPEDRVPPAGTAATDATAGATGWLAAALVAAGFNLVLLLAGGVWWWARRRGGVEVAPSFEQLLAASPAPGRADAAVPAGRTGSPSREEAA